LDKYVGAVWDEVQQPYLLSDEDNLWIRITPKEILLAPFTTKGNKLNITLVFYAQVESVFGAQPVVKNKVPLPSLRYIERQPQQFSINVGADVTFDKIAEFARIQLQGKSFTESGKIVKIDNISLYSSNGRAVVVADLSGSYKGRIYFTGKPAYNSEKQSLEIIEPEFDIKTQNALIKSANWLLHGMILKKITPMLTYPLEETLKTLKDQANSMLKSYEVYSGVHITGSLDSLAVTTVSMVPGAVRVGAEIKGNVALIIDELKF